MARAPFNRVTPPQRPTADVFRSHQPDRIVQQPGSPGTAADRWLDRPGTEPARGPAGSAGYCRRNRQTWRAGQLHPAVDARRPQPHRHVRSEAVGPGRDPRRTQPDRHQGSRPGTWRVDAQHGRLCRQVLGHPLDALLLAHPRQGRPPPDERQPSGGQHGAARLRSHVGLAAGTTRPPDSSLRPGWHDLQPPLRRPRPRRISRPDLRSVRGGKGPEQLQLRRQRVQPARFGFQRPPVGTPEPAGGG